MLKFGMPIAFITPISRNSSAIVKPIENLSITNAVTSSRILIIIIMVAAIIS